MFSLTAMATTDLSVMENLSLGTSLAFAHQVAGASDNVLSSKAYCLENGEFLVGRRACLRCIPAYIFQ